MTVNYLKELYSSYVMVNSTKLQRVESFITEINTSDAGAFCQNVFLNFCLNLCHRQQTVWKILLDINFKYPVCL